MKQFHNEVEAGTEQNLVQRELQRSISINRRNLLVCLLLVIVIAVYFSLSGQRSLVPLLEEDRFSIEGLDGTVHSFTYAEAERIELRRDFQSFDRGERLDGTETRRCCSGIYRNEEFGEYQLHAMSRLNNYIVVYLPDEILVLNYESDATTENLYESFTEDSE